MGVGRFLFDRDLDGTYVDHRVRFQSRRSFLYPLHKNFSQETLNSKVINYSFE